LSSWQPLQRPYATSRVSMTVRDTHPDGCADVMSDMPHRPGVSALRERLG